MIGVLAAEKELSLESKIDDKVPKILRGDSGKIKQVLLNLLNNAIKFADSGKIIISVETTAPEHNGRCEIKISVMDQGIGLLPDQMDRLFAPFTQSDESTSRKYGGTGLGLSISKRLVEAMGGKMGVQSSPNEGTTFWFSLKMETKAPLIAVAEKSVVQIKSTDEKILAHRNSIRVLIAEDNKTNQLIIMTMMSILGYSCTLAKNGEEAVNLFKQLPFDIVLMDHHMPVKDGIQASREIRAYEGAFSHTPIIAFTATVIQDEQRREYTNLFDDYILKPITLEALETRLISWEPRNLKSMDTPAPLR